MLRGGLDACTQMPACVAPLGSTGAAPPQLACNHVRVPAPAQNCRPAVPLFAGENYGPAGQRRHVPAHLWHNQGGTQTRPSHPCAVHPASLLRHSRAGHILQHPASNTARLWRPASREAAALGQQPRQCSSRRLGCGSRRCVCCGSCSGSGGAAPPVLPAAAASSADFFQLGC